MVSVLIAMQFIFKKTKMLKEVSKSHQYNLFTKHFKILKV